MVKETKFGERYTVKYTLDIYNLTNTTSFDIPGANVAQNQYYNSFASPLGAGVSPAPTGCGTSTEVSPGPGGIYFCPAGLGLVTHTIGAPRQVQMSLHLDF